MRNDNKGFSLVELIIVIAIMAVLIGVVAPTYLQYVEKSKKTADCTTIGTVMDAIEVAAMDPDVKWPAGESVSVTIGDSSATYTYNGTGTGVVAAIESIAPSGAANLSASWAPVSFDATRGTEGKITFDNLSGASVADIRAVSPPLANRFE